MKKIIIPLLFTIFLLNTSVKVHAQCKQQFVYDCAKRNGKAIYLRDFNAKLRKGKEGAKPPQYTYKIVLNQGTLYRFNVCAPEGWAKKVELKLFDGNLELGSNFNRKSKKRYSAFDFPCRKTAVYVVSISHEDGEKGCAVGILSFVEKIKN